MKKGTSKILLSIFGVILIVFIFYHTLRPAFSPVSTETAYPVTVSDTIKADGFVIRDEKTVTSDKTGIMVYNVDNGGKVAKGSTIVEYFNSDEDVKLKSEIEQLEEKISQLNELDTQNEILAADLDMISSQIKSNLLNMLNDIDVGNLSKASSYENKLLYLLNQNQLATKRTENYKQQIAEYTDKLKDLKSRYTPGKDQLYSQYSGYFVNSADGYETAVSYDDVKTITVDKINDIKKADVSKNTIGKIVSEHQWYIVTVIDRSQSLDLKLTDTVDVKLPLSTASEIEATVEALNVDRASDKVAVVLSCDNMNPELSLIRKQPIEIVLRNYKGLRVNSKAIRIVDGKKGVYVQLGNIVKFREIEIIYASQGFAVVKSDNSSGQLKIYDEVIVKGKNLGGDTDG
ncbi:MAG: hypothetical protein IJF54_04390 [Clostridia bacterium]|nr:hypothetical protein [Clostridia bacterium]